MIQSYYVLKIAGSVLLVTSGVLVGLKIKKKLRMRKELLCEYKAGLDFLESRILLDELALCDCMEDCEKRFCGNYPEFNVFSRFKNNLSEGKYSAEDAWMESVNEVSENGLLINDEIELLSSLSVILGRSDVQHHSAHIKEVVEKLDVLICEADNKLKKDGNLYLKLCAAAAAVMVLLLW